MHHVLQSGSRILGFPVLGLNHYMQIHDQNTIIELYHL